MVLALERRNAMQASDIALVVIGIIVALFVVTVLLSSGANTQRIGLACRCFGRALRDQAFADQVVKLLAPPEPKPARPSGVPVRLLAILQRDGRLLDFFMEDLSAATPDQIVAAVRDIHPQCQAALKKHLVLGPVLTQTEGESVEVPAGFDPSAIRVTGNVTGQPPFHGTLLHPGWRVIEIKLPPLPEGQDDLVLMPAEVELP
jgi:hypothetical protein